MSLSYEVWDEAKIPPNLLWHYVGLTSDPSTYDVECQFPLCGGTVTPNKTFNNAWVVNCSNCGFTGTPLQFVKNTVPDYKNIKDKGLSQVILDTCRDKVSVRDIRTSRAMHNFFQSINTLVNDSRLQDDTFADFTTKLCYTRKSRLKSCWSTIGKDEIQEISKKLKRLPSRDDQKFDALSEGGSLLVVPVFDAPGRVAGVWFVNNNKRTMFVGTEEMSLRSTTGAGFLDTRVGKVIVTLSPLRAVTARAADLGKRIVPVHGNTTSISRMLNLWNTDVVILGDATPKNIRLAAYLDCKIIPEKFGPSFNSAMDWKPLLVNFLNGRTLVNYRDFINKCGGLKIIEKIKDKLNVSVLKNINQAFNNERDCVTYNNELLVLREHSWVLAKTGEPLTTFDIKLVRKYISTDDTVKYIIRIISNDVLIDKDVESSVFRGDTWGWLENVAVRAGVDRSIEINARVSNKLLQLIACRDVKIPVV